MLLAAIAKLLLYGGVTVVLGQAALPSSGEAAPPWLSRLRATVLAGWVALCVGTIAVLLAQALELELGMSPEAYSTLLGTSWGRAWTALAASVLLGTVAFGLRWRPQWQLTFGGLVATAIGGIGHAAADAEWPVLSRLLDMAHVVGVGIWIGGLYLVSRIAAHDRTEAVWARFSGLAAVMAPMGVLAGAVASYRRLSGATFGEALASDYGRLWLAKVALALLVLALGAVHRRKIVKGLRPGTGSVRFELAVAAFVLVVTSVLTGTAPPGE